MHFARVCGTVVGTQKTPGLVGHRLLLIQPTDSRLRDLDQTPVVAVDLVSAAPGQPVLFVKAREAANALPDKHNPVDATILAIVDEVSRPL